jgi:hypothetical protein
MDVPVPQGIVSANSTGSPLLAISAILMVVTCLLMAGAYYVNWASEFSAILIFVAGGTLVTALDLIGSMPLLLQERLQTARGVLHGRFDEERIAAIVAELYQRLSIAKAEAGPAKRDAGLRGEELEWGPRHFLGSDDALALAHLRLLIETEIRRLALESGKIPLHQTSVSALMRVLVARDVLPNEIEAALVEVIAVCDSAVHGASIPPDMAGAVVGIGEDILDLLRSLHAEPFRPAPAPAGGL